ncbi:SCAN domain-containing protein 3 [Plecturocebus cupreus]
MEAQLLGKINEPLWYTIQVDKSTDVDNKATMLIFEDVHEEMLYALLLPTITTPAKLFKSLNDYMSGKLNWSFWVGVFMGGVAAMTGRLSGFTTWVKEIASECESMHYVIPRAG